MSSHRFQSYDHILKTFKLLMDGVEASKYTQNIIKNIVFSYFMDGKVGQGPSQVIER